MNKLSQPQQDFLRVLTDVGAKGYRCPFVGGRQAKTVASAWHRTMLSLLRRGLVVAAREGDSVRAWLPEHAPDMSNRYLSYRGVYGGTL